MLTGSCITWQSSPTVGTASSTAAKWKSVFAFTASESTDFTAVTTLPNEVEVGQFKEEEVEEACSSNAEMSSD